MAAFKQHITFSSVLGAGYAVAMWQLNFEWPQAVLAGVLCAFSGMLPDLDSDSGRPVQELFGVIAAVVPLFFLRRLRRAEISTEATILIMVGIYLFIRFGVSAFFKRVTVHRGMFHSLPAALIAAELLFLACDSTEPHGPAMMAGGVLIGFLSHLVLDELWSVNSQGLAIRLNKAAGSALKLASRSMPATLFTWLILFVLTYFVGVKQEYVKPIALSFLNPINRMAQR